MDFTNKTVLITGSSRGIGRAAAIAFADKNAKVAIHYAHNKNAAEETLATLKGDGHILLQADISDPQAVEQLLKSAHQQLGHLDIVVNNAGIFNTHPIEEVSYEAWHQYQPHWRS